MKDRKPMGYWTKEKCQEVTLQFDNKSDFMKNYLGAYKSCLRNNWLDEVCSHMKQFRKPDGYWTKEKCQEELGIIHNYKYDYSLFKFIDFKTKVKIICPIHGEFEQRFDHHLNGHRCKRCKGFEILNHEDFMKRSNEVHNNKYKYPFNDYKNNHTKVKIICPIHGEFEQIPSGHLNGKGCRRCKGIEVLNQQDFIKKSSEVHNFEYDYSLSDYINAKTKVKIICKNHGVFEQTPDNHISKKQGCPYCNKSVGEEKIKKYLDEFKIDYNRQYNLYEENKKHPLRADFYLPKYNLIIEYNGTQHYNEIKYFGGLKTLIDIKDRDRRKKLICEKNNIKLIIIPYTKFNEIKNILLTNII